MSDADRPGYSFNPGPPPEASGYLARKGWQPAFGWRDVEPEEHAVAFSVAKAMQMDVLAAIRDELQRALDEGLPFEAFRRSLTPRLQALGWWGTMPMVDPVTGEERFVRLGSPRRLRVIYETNLRSARAAGQWARIQRSKRALPYLLYQLGPSEVHRDEHLAKEGLVLPVDDPFWQSWFPPNGWGCKCWVRQITRAEAERRGISDSPRVQTREWVNRRTGEVKRVPVGIDPGWERNPGALRLEAAERLLEDRLLRAPEAVARTAARDIAGSWRAARLLEGSAPGSVPVAVLPAELAAALGAQTRVVRLGADSARHIRERHPEVTAATLVAFADALHDGPAGVEEGAERAQLIVFTRSPQPWRLVVKVLRTAGELWMVTAHRARPDQWAGMRKRPGFRVIRE